MYWWCDFKGIPDYMDQDANGDGIPDEEDRDTDLDGMSATLVV